MTKFDTEYNKRFDEVMSACARDYETPSEAMLALQKLGAYYGDNGEHLVEIKGEPIELSIYKNGFCKWRLAIDKVI